MKGFTVKKYFFGDLRTWVERFGEQICFPIAQLKRWIDSVLDRGLTVFFSLYRMHIIKTYMKNTGISILFLFPYVSSVPYVQPSLAAMPHKPHVNELCWNLPWRCLAVTSPPNASCPELVDTLLQQSINWNGRWMGGSISFYVTRSAEWEWTKEEWRNCARKREKSQTEERQRKVGKEGWSWGDKQERQQREKEKQKCV